MLNGFRKVACVFAETKTKQMPMSMSLKNFPRVFIYSEFLFINFPKIIQ